MLIIPKLKYDYIYIENEFSGRPEIAYTGTIIKRFSTQSDGIIYHYCIILGVDTKNKILVIHNDTKGVEIKTFDDWNEGWGDAFTVDFFNKDQSRIPEIISRVTEASEKHFHLKLNNCEHFVNYVVFGDNFKQSVQIQMIDLFQKLFFLGFDLQAQNSSEETQNRYATFKKNILKPKYLKFR